jgi:hypothetical protein
MIWGWCLVFLIAGQQPIVQFDYKTEADCDASRIAVKALHEDADRSPGACRSPSRTRPRRQNPRSGSRCEAPSGDEGRRFATLSCPLASA